MTDKILLGFTSSRILRWFTDSRRTTSVFLSAKRTELADVPIYVDAPRESGGPK
jgi:hypothetical protein